MSDGKFKKCTNIFLPPMFQEELAKVNRSGSDARSAELAEKQRRYYFANKEKIMKRRAERMKEIRDENGNSVQTSD